MKLTDLSLVKTMTFLDRIPYGVDFVALPKINICLLVKSGYLYQMTFLKNYTFLTYKITHSLTA